MVDHSKGIIVKQIFLLILTTLIADSVSKNILFLYIFAIYNFPDVSCNKKELSRCRKDCIPSGEHRLHLRKSLRKWYLKMLRWYVVSLQIFLVAWTYWTGNVLPWLHLHGSGGRLLLQNWHDLRKISGTTEWHYWRWNHYHDTYNYNNQYNDFSSWKLNAHCVVNYNKRVRNRLQLSLIDAFYYVDLSADKKATAKLMKTNISYCKLLLYIASSCIEELDWVIQEHWLRNCSSFFIPCKSMPAFKIQSRSIILWGASSSHITLK